jgi:hypothetical protein
MPKKMQMQKLVKVELDKMMKDKRKLNKTKKLINKQMLIIKATEMK